MDSNEKYDVFLSYSANDRAWVDVFVKSLRAAGVSAWFDAAEIRLGDKWEDRIQDALRQSRVLVVILTANSAASPWTFFELGAAVADKKAIIPVLTEDVAVGALPMPLRRYQFLKESSPEIAGRRVAEAVSQVMQSAA